jgi:hypothetical protein
MYRSSFCDGAPFLYLSVHDGDNIYKYSRNGCLLSSKVLVGHPQYADKKHIMEARGVVLHPVLNPLLICY